MAIQNKFLKALSGLLMVFLLPGSLAPARSMQASRKNLKLRVSSVGFQWS